MTETGGEGSTSGISVEEVGEGEVVISLGSAICVTVIICDFGRFGMEF